MRVRDSLLGRQIVAKSPLACVRLALEEPSPIANAIQASLRQMVARVGRQDNYLPTARVYTIFELGASNLGKMFYTFV